MNLEDILGLLIPVTFVLFLIIERLVPGSEQPRVPRWFVKGILFFLLIGAANAVIPAVVLSAVAGYTVLDLSGLGTLGGALVALLATDLVSYWIHRGMHNSSFVWRWTHQMHHSAERMDMLGAAYFHPFDFFFQQIVPSIGLMVLLGITPLAGALGGYLGFFFGVLPHLNVKTPSWLGYLIQRPEMHAVHHTRDVHAYNYGLFALSDLIFGTWRNPERFPDAPYGFWDGASRKLGAMLIGRDVGRAQ
jgi:sterol desaturase/sphingolipid hydroxylase (fatty acid hydroxylase superfamily)